MQQKKSHAYDKNFFQISPPVAKYAASHSPIQSHIPTILVDKELDIQSSLLFHEEGGRSSWVPPCYLSSPHQKQDDKLATSFQFFSCPTHKQKMILLFSHVFVWSRKTLSVIDDPSTSTIRFHYTEMPHQLVSCYFVFSHKTEKKFASSCPCRHTGLFFLSANRQLFLPWESF